MKKWCAGPVGKFVGGVDIPHRRALVPAGDHGVVEAVHLQPAVVAAAVVAGRGHHAEGAPSNVTTTAAVSTSPYSANRGSPCTLPVAYTSTAC